MLPVRLYKGNPYWIRPLDKDVEDTFNPEKNKNFKYGECIRWIAVDDSGQTSGASGGVCKPKYRQQRK